MRMTLPHAVRLTSDEGEGAGGRAGDASPAETLLRFCGRAGTLTPSSSERSLRRLSMLCGSFLVLCVDGRVNSMGQSGPMTMEVPRRSLEYKQ